MIKVKRKGQLKRNKIKKDNKDNRSQEIREEIGKILKNHQKIWTIRTLVEREGTE